MRTEKQLKALAEARKHIIRKPLSEATKENYLKCCERCRKLFLGEEVEDE